MSTRAIVGTLGVARTAPTPSSAILVQTPTASTYSTARPTPVAIYCHGAGETESTVTTNSDELSVVTALRAAGFIVATSYEHGNNWGNATARADLLELWKYLRATYVVKPSVFMCGQSMGGLAALTSIAESNLPVNGCGLIYPVTNLANLYGIGTYTSDINTAYSCTSGTYSTATAGSDPQLQSAAAFAAVTRFRFYASTGDTVVPKAQNSDLFAAKIASQSTESTVVACTGNHGDSSHFQPSDMTAFALRCVDGI